MGAHVRLQVLALGEGFVTHITFISSGIVGVQGQVFLQTWLLQVHLARIRCTSWFNAGYSIIENNLRGYFFVSIMYLLNLTCPKITINYIIFNNFNKQHFTRKYTRSDYFLNALFAAKSLFELLRDNTTKVLDISNLHMYIILRYKVAALLWKNGYLISFQFHSHHS